MRLFSMILSSICLLTACKKDFDPENPNVAQFVSLVKKDKLGDYPEMPKFKETDIPALLKFAADTSHIAKYPVNPITSRGPYPIKRNYLILTECLLWTIEGIRIERPYGSLVPYMSNNMLPEERRLEGLSGIQVLSAREKYLAWWEQYKDDLTQLKQKNPLENSDYKWW
jgi:hypothetical protein